LNNLLLNK